MSATERLELTLLQQQIVNAWAHYKQAEAAWQLDTARLAMAHVDRLLERLPRPRVGD